MSTFIGQPHNRVEGRKKVTGRAAYAADHRFDQLLHACGVMSTVASGRIRSLDTSKALAAPGVVDVLHHDNIAPLSRPTEDMENDIKMSEGRPPFADDRVWYAGQFVALVLAETYEQARYAAHLVRVTYAGVDPRPPSTLDAGLAAGPENRSDESDDYQRGDPDRRLADGAGIFDARYTTPVEAHNAMELHATTARWENERLIVHDSTQWVVGQRQTLAAVLGLDPERITVHAPFIGGGFGSKLFLWPHAILAAVASRRTGRPVKLVLGRRDQFTTAGNRAFTRQRIRASLTPDGRLCALRHDTHSHTSLVHDYVESCGSLTRNLYACDDLAVTHRIVPLPIGTPCPMRAPGAASGTFALECAIDELAARAGVDPLDFRLRNLPERDPAKDRPWSSHHLADCLRLAAERGDWSRRNPRPGAMRDGREVIGWGLAAAGWPSERDSASVTVELLADGSARARCATQDIGTGTYTVIAQVVAEITRIPVERIQVVIGDSSLPRGPISGGSMVTATVVPAFAAASRRALEELFAAATAAGAPFAGAEPGSLEMKDAMLRVRNDGRQMSVANLLAATGRHQISASADAAPGEAAKKFTTQSFGAHCVQVRWDPGIARLRVGRIVSVIDAGRIINHKTALNQIHGSLVMGLGMALLEHSVYDPATARPVTDNLADYLLPVHADTPEMDVTLLNRPDPKNGEFGVKGIGEVGITGVAAAIANAVHHATGRRIRDLPITIEKLIG